MKEFYIDLFSGAGGTTTGIHLVNGNIEVVACVNHDANAIESHKANHPQCLHLTEDVRDYKVIKMLRNLVVDLRKNNPGCIINIWASLECTNYSKAKGGLPRDADSRTLAYTLYNYIDELEPDKVYIENVREFMAWGPLDKKGKPISRLNGRDYQDWVNTIEGFDYAYGKSLLNAADFEAYTSRERYFGIFSKSYPIAWPQPTASKNPEVNGLKKWKAVREVLDLNDEGASIFFRKNPLVENTLKRILAGLIKFVAGGEKAFTKVYNSGNDIFRVKSINEPLGSLTTQNSHAVVKASFLKKYFNGNPNGKVVSIEGPAGTITTVDHHALVSSIFLTAHYSTGLNVHSLSKPCPTVSTKDRFSKVETQFFVDQQYGASKPSDINSPAGAITSNPKLNLVSFKACLINKNSSTAPAKSINDPSPTITQRTHYLLNPQFKDKGRSVDDPCFTLIARMDKKPPYLVEIEKGLLAIVVYETDSPTTVKIKEFMALYGIVDIKMRMLKIPELLKIQGFPDGYILKGTKTEQKKYIGNAVVPVMAAAIVQANHKANINYLTKVA